MYLKSLTIRGFKSFASSTTLHFEPGITAIVGPNGSGKSNVVDAITWVMGEQGAKALRGGKMEDVIFSGSAGRAPLGRAEVLLTIDNTDGALPIEYSEVTIQRTMFRSGGSEYSINGTQCRLLDIQELLSDSGIGREMHVIVGQNKVQDILLSSPDALRGFVEEAAGVLKHRKRKEKAVRKLEAMQVNLNRLEDLTGELRRQLKPLGRQAEVARRANVIQSDVRDARLRLLADDLVAMQEALAAEIADETQLREKRSEVESALTAARAREAVLESNLNEGAPQVEAAQQAFYALGGLQERMRGTLALAKERVRQGSIDEGEEQQGRDPDEMEREAGQLRSQEAELTATLEQGKLELVSVTTQRSSLEAALAAEEARLQSAHRAVADRREGLARLAGQVATARTRIETRSAEIARLTEQRELAQARADEAVAEFTAIETQVAGLDEGELGLDAQHTSASEQLARAEGELRTARSEEQAADRERAAAAARLEALEQGMHRKDGGAALLAASDEMSGILGAVAALLHIDAGWQFAVSAALGAAADAIAVANSDAAQAAVRRLRRDDAGRAALVVVGAGTSNRASWPVLDGGLRYAVDAVSTEADLLASLADLLDRVVLAETLEDAQRIVANNPALRAATRDGDLIGRGFVHGGTHGAQSLVELQAAVDEARNRLEAAANRAERARFAVAQCEQELSAATALVDAALERLHESDARMAAVAEQLGQLQGTARSAKAEAERYAEAIEAAGKALADDERTLAELDERHANAQQLLVPESDLAEGERERLAAELVRAREDETQQRLAVRTLEERVQALAEQAGRLEHAARLERTARAKAIEARERRLRHAAVASAVVVAAETTIELLNQSVVLAEHERDRLVEERKSADLEVRAVREKLRELAAELEVLTDTVHRDEVARAEQRMRIEALETKALEDFGVGPEALIEEYGPAALVPPSPPAPGDEVDPNAPEPAPYPYVRQQQEQRLASAERSLALLGKVNPLALEEFAALEERHRFLGEQLEDLRKSRNDLLTMIKDVDERVMQLFAEAFSDTEKEFARMFPRLFPGGEARLVLTEPGDLLNTGVAIEARPPGKTYKPLSLLSGGEKSLGAVAFLIALFTARPSPFYIMDEVEQALDDVNLNRLLAILAELRDHAQLLIVTHQKSTMEIADMLYGVSMRNDGVTQVISQRIRHDEHVTPEEVADSVPAG